MLRILKQKAMETSSQDGRKQAQIPNPETPESHSPIIVSHIPVSIGSHKHSSSASSTISSKSYEGTEVITEPSGATSHGFVKFSQEKVQQSGKYEDSCNESSRLVSPFMTSTAPPLKSLSRRRTVSMEDLLQQSVSQPRNKKPKLALHLQVDSPVEPLTSSSTTLLATSEDSQCLNPLHIFVRKQIEVFTATEIELRQPAPGRKQPIQLTQVGLRCIHCKSKPKASRVKRAVCYPTNIGRIYSAVSDMKFDHFNHCLNLPSSVRAEFDYLKKLTEHDVATDDKNKRKSRTSSTSQFYCDSAMSLGLHDGPGGIFMSPTAPSFSAPSTVRGTLRSSAPIKTSHAVLSINKTHSNQPLSLVVDKKGDSHQQRRSLREDSDSDNLNAIHCFVRTHTEFFAANEEDIVAPAPGRKTKVLMGQVGIRCIHCSSLPPQQRVKRAACYPPRVEGIYHAISNMKFDHFAKCQGLPDNVRREFQTLQDSFCRKGSGGNAGGAASSTKKYYRASAVRKGLADTDTGIRFQTTCPRSTSPSSEVSDRMSALVEVACLAV